MGKLLICQYPSPQVYTKHLSQYVPDKVFEDYKCYIKHSVDTFTVYCEETKT